VKECGAELKYGNACRLAATYGSTRCYFHEKQLAGLFDSRPAPKRNRSSGRLRLTDAQTRQFEPIIRGVANDFGGGEDRMQDAWEGVLSAPTFDPQRGTTLDAFVRFHARSGINNAYRRGLGDKRSKNGNYEHNLAGRENTFATSPAKLDDPGQRGEERRQKRVTSDRHTRDDFDDPE
jgi:hypothetical protein